MNRIAFFFILALFGLPTSAVSQQDSLEINDFQEQMLEAAERLDLSDAQHAQLEPILRAHFEKTRSLLSKHGLDQPSGGRSSRRQLFALSQDLRPQREQTDRKVAAILSDDQMAEYRQIQDERRAQMRARLQGGRG